MKNKNIKIRNEPLVDVIIPFYNEEIYLPSCILSLKRQKYIKKIIGINDFSTDNSKSICKKHNLYVIDMDVPSNLRKSLLADNLNLGLKHSDAKYIFRIDADTELISSKYIEILVDFMENEKNMQYYSAGGLVYVIKPRWLMILNKFFRKIPRGTARIYRRRILEKIGGFNYKENILYTSTFGRMVYEESDTATDKVAEKLHYKTKFIRKIEAIHHRPCKIHFTYNLISDSFYRNMVKLFCALIGFSPKMILKGIQYLKILFRYKISRLIV